MTQKLKNYDRAQDVWTLKAIVHIGFIGSDENKQSAALECMDEIDLKYNKFPKNQRLEIAIDHGYVNKILPGLKDKYQLFARMD